MSTTYNAITEVLEARLATLTPALTTNWENTKTVMPVDGSAFQIVNHLPAEPENPTYGNTMYRERGLMQVTLSYPLLGGAAAARARAEAIRELFPRASSLIASGGAAVVIERTPMIGIGRPIDGRWLVPVSIRYFANIV